VLMAFVLSCVLASGAFAEDPPPYTDGEVTVTWSSEPDGYLALYDTTCASVSANYDPKFDDEVERIQGNLTYSFDWSAGPGGEITNQAPAAPSTQNSSECDVGFNTASATVDDKTVSVTCTVTGTIELIGPDGEWDTEDDEEIPLEDSGTSPDANLTVVALDEMEYSLDGETWNEVDGTIYVSQGTTVQFRVSKQPAAADWPTGKPEWSGTSGASGTGATKSVAFNTLSTSTSDYKTVIAECGNTLTANVIVCQVAIKKPFGDPTSSPASDAAYSDDSSSNANVGNERTFSSASTASVSTLTVPCEVAVTPTGAAVGNQLKWTITAIAGTTLTWDDSWAGQSTVGKGLSPTGTFTTPSTGLPANNSDFGQKTVTMQFVSVDGAVVMDGDSNSIEVFYPKTGKNHPGDDQTPAGQGSARSPNWFYYWNKAIGSTSVKYNSNTAGDLYGCVPAMLHWDPAMTYSKSEIWVDDPAAETLTHEPPAPDTNTTRGIDCFNDVLLHEGVHVTQIPIADAALGALDGKAGTIWEKGWSFNKATHNHWTLGADGKAGVANVNDDSDGTTDEETDNSEVGFAGSDDVNLDNPWNDIPPAQETANPAWIEPAAYAAEVTDDNDNAASDWGSPGKQHKNNNTYDD